MTLIKVHVNVFGREQRTVEVKKGSRIIDVLEKLSLNPVEIVVAKNGEVVPEDDFVSDGDKLDFYSVVSGG